VLDIDEKAKTVRVKNLKTGEVFTDSYDKLAVTTGARGKSPDIPGMNLKNIYMLRSMEDGINVKALLEDEAVKNVVIIGSGPIGLETAHVVRHLGKNLKLIVKYDRILSRYFDPEITKILEEELLKHKAELHFNELATEMQGDGSVKKVLTNKGAYDADLVIHSIGAVPNTEFLQNTSIAMDRGAIIVDEFGRTSSEDIYSAGDCATIYNIVKGCHSYSPLATVANKLGRIIGDNMVGGNVKFTGSLDSMCIQVMDMEAGRTGLCEFEAKELGLDYRCAFIKDVNQTGYYPGQENIFIKIVYDAKTKVLLGGQAVGYKGAVLRVNTLAACIYGKLTTHDLAYLDLCYAP
jgi:NADPH-dependent 2,4-dienoyl-CoA reductase/sulfur reductase-like enzyme